MAEGLHRASNRADRPLIKVNCAALPDDLLESELFGYEKGAFTGAIKDKPGRFQLADGGTLFLDEIGEMPAALQAKLLRALQEKTVEPLGSVKTIKVDTRIIAATNRNLKVEVEAGRFVKIFSIGWQFLKYASRRCVSARKTCRFWSASCCAGLATRTTRSFARSLPRFSMRCPGMTGPETCVNWRMCWNAR